MKVAFLAPEFLPTLGGVGTYSVELVRNLSGISGIEIHVFTPKRGKKYDLAKIQKKFNKNVIIHNLGYGDDGFFYNLRFQLALLFHFRGFQKQYNFDLIHAANLVHMPDIFLKLSGLKLPSVTTIHTTLKSQSHVQGRTKLGGEKARVEQLTRLFYPLISVLERIYLRKSKNLIAVSNWIKGFVKTQAKIHVIHNGINTKVFRPRKLQSISKKSVVLFCGRLLALKGLATLIDAMRIVLETHDVLFVFAGTGDIDNWKAKMNGIPEESYKFLGYVDYEKIHLLYPRADIFVLPSLTESFPLTLLEAMSCGLPVVATQVGGIPEMINHGRNGLLVKAQNPEQLADAIISLLDNPKQMESMGAKAREIVLQKFGSKNTALKTKKLYDEIK